MLVGAVGQPSAPGSKRTVNCPSSGTGQARVGGGSVAVGEGEGVGEAGAGEGVASGVGVCAEGVSSVCVASPVGVRPGCEVTATTGASVAAPGPSRSVNVAQPTPTAKAKINNTTAPATQSHRRLRRDGGGSEGASGIISKSSGFATILPSITTYPARRSLVPTTPPRRSLVPLSAPRRQAAQPTGRRRPSATQRVFQVRSVKNA